MQMFHVLFLTAALPYQRAEAGKTKSVILMIMMKKKAYGLASKNFYSSQNLKNYSPHFICIMFFTLLCNNIERYLKFQQLCYISQT